MGLDAQRIRWLESLRLNDVASVGGKNASMGELLAALVPQGIRVPGGFATTAQLYWEFLDANKLRPRLEALLARLAKEPLPDIGRELRATIQAAPWPAHLAEAVKSAYRELCQREGKDIDVAVRSSATAEDMPEASFAGQHESYLNVRGEDAALEAIRDCFASLFTDRAITYRQAHGFDHMRVALSAGVQRMVRSDQASSGVMFTIDTETGFPRSILINAAWGLGETVVQGTVNPDQYTVFSPLLDDARVRPILERLTGSKLVKRVYAHGGGTVDAPTSPQERQARVLDDESILQLAKWGKLVAEHYGRPMDIEWARDGPTGQLFIVQARPETVESRHAATIETYKLQARGAILATGQAIGHAIATGKLVRASDPHEASRVPEGSLLVTRMTDPDWGPALRRVAGIITDLGGRTCHAAIVARELGIPAIVGAGDATTRLKPGVAATLACSEGPVGHVYEGILPFSKKTQGVGSRPKSRTHVLLNIGSPDEAMQWWRLPAQGIGLARLEFLVANVIQAHPMALLHPEKAAKEDWEKIRILTAGYASGADYFVDRLATGIARIAASRWPDPVVVRMSDFKTNEYARLLGGAAFEPHEENPMIGWRGASRYYREGYREGFQLECRALRRAREELGFTNVQAMIPFCRTLGEADRVLEAMKEAGLERGRNGLKVIVMCEIPSNALSAAEFAQRFDGFSIGSNDLTQLTLGLDRDSATLGDLFDEGDPAVKRLIRMVIEDAHKAGATVGLCGQAPSDRPDFARFLVECGIDSISVSADAWPTVRDVVLAAERNPGDPYAK